MQYALLFAAIEVDTEPEKTQMLPYGVSLCLPFEFFQNHVSAMMASKKSLRTLKNKQNSRRYDMNYSQEFSFEKKSPEEWVRELEEIDEIIETIRRENDYRMEP